MPKKQTRRSISLKPERYDQLKTYCDVHGLSMSSVVEKMVAKFFAPKTADTYPGSDLPKEVPPAATRGPIRGGGIHEL
jgi:hypothetical protein